MLMGWPGARASELKAHLRLVLPAVCPSVHCGTVCPFGFISLFPFFLTDILCSRRCFVDIWITLSSLPPFSFSIFHHKMFTAFSNYPDKPTGLLAAAAVCLFVCLSVARYDSVTHFRLFLGFFFSSPDAGVIIPGFVVFLYFNVLSLPTTHSFCRQLCRAREEAQNVIFTCCCCCWLGSLVESRRTAISAFQTHCETDTFGSRKRRRSGRKTYNFGTICPRENERRHFGYF